MGRTEAVIILFMILIAASGCITDGKTVIKSKILIIESEGTPNIVSIDVSTDKVSVLRKCQDTTMHTPGVYMRCILYPEGENMGTRISYWRSTDYTGSGEYELISELTMIPENGDRIDTIMTIEDVDAEGRSVEITKSTKSIIWYE